MRPVAALLLCVSLAAGCDRSSQLTAEQEQQVEAARSATVATSERMLGRPLTGLEKQCIHVDFKEGRTVGRITAPLSETLKKRQAELIEQSKRQQ